MHQLGPDSEDPSLPIHSGLDSATLTPLLAGSHEVLTSSLCPFHRTGQAHGKGSHDVFLWIDNRLGPETTSDIRGDHPHLVGGELEIGCDQVADRVWGLGRGPQSETAFDIVPSANNSPPLHRSQGSAMLVDLDGDPMWCPVEDRVDIAVSDGDRAHQIRFAACMSRWRPCHQRRSMIDHDREDLVVNENITGGIDSSRLTLGDHDCHGLTHETDLINGQW